MVQVKMGKKSKSQAVKPDAAQSSTNTSFLGGNASVDPALVSLFEQSVRCHIIVRTIADLIGWPSKGTVNRQWPDFESGGS